MSGISGALLDAWRIAESVRHDAGRRAVRLEGGAHRTWATIAMDGSRGVLIEVPATELLGPTVAAVGGSTDAMHAEIYPFEDGGRDVRGLLLECRVQSLLPVFVGFCEPFVTRTEAGAPVGSAFIACFDEFRALLAAEAEGEATSADSGVIGELIVLKDLVDGHPEAVGYWGRPAAERHDFRNGDIAIEVKSSQRAAAARPVAKISAIDQLEPPSPGSLYLVFIRLERNPGGDIAIGSLIESLRGKLRGDLLAMFNRKVAGVEGNGRRHRVRFSCLDKAAYRVDSGFPRLTPSQLITGEVDPGLSNIKYDLDLSTAGRFKCDLSFAHDALCRQGASR